MVFKGFRNQKISIIENLYIVYVDESGTPGLKTGRYYILFSLVVPLVNNYAVKELGARLLSNLRNFGYNQNEIKGSEIFKLFKKRKQIDNYINIIKNITTELNNLDSFIVSIIIDKKRFIEGVIPKFRKRLDSALSKPPVGYLNVLSVPRIRNKIISSIIDKNSDLIIRAQSINELLVRIQKEFERRKSFGIVVFDSEADTLASSAYGLVAEDLTRDGLAYVKGGLGKPDRILHVSLTQSSLDYGIQIADLLVNSLYNCMVHNLKEIYSYLERLFLEMGVAIIPKGIEVCK